MAVQYKKSDFYYDLPPELIAQTPAEPRDSSRMLVYDRAADRVEHRIFRDVTDYLKAGDVLVINNTKVLPARLYAHTPNGGAVEILLLKRLDKDKWEVLCKPGKKCAIGKSFTINEKLSFTVEDITDSGERIVRFSYDGVFENILEEAGSMPLPPYIKEKLKDKNRYQTVYAKTDGSAAAPTAGLHFTPELMQKIRAMGVEIVEVLLHVGLGTFRPVKEDIITDHKMHGEYYEVSQAAADTINRAKAEGRRIIAVGTTSVRTLESGAGDNGILKAGSGETHIFIYPPYK
ncbi:MAG: tRNA preQ1(34) S-adenosylmethionine ribosyltransferase-isomerase QueA, partial [Clostridia bacterium]|nr:tRNA preQ1(34) S-adenosylmethionine ribosyltransferase-isomerase QueA [Clostridia bacterium]